MLISSNLLDSPVLFDMNKILVSVLSCRLIHMHFMSAWTLDNSHYIAWKYYLHVLRVSS